MIFGADAPFASLPLRQPPSQLSLSQAAAPHLHPVTG